MKVRICPHCGASVTGDTEQCPSCDNRLEIIDDEEVEILYARSIMSGGTNKSILEESSIPTEVEDFVPKSESQDAAPETQEPNLVADQESTPNNLFQTPRIEVREPDSQTAEFDAKRESTPTNEQHPLTDEQEIPVLESPSDDNGIREATPQHTTPKPVDFENAQTAPLISSHLRPAIVAPEPEPLPAMETQPKIPTIPPAPYTPPPAPSVVVPIPYAPLPSTYWLEQRVQAYMYGGYQLQRQKANEAVLSYGKSVGFFWWIVGSMTIVGILWYWFILLISAFRRDEVFVILEPDGYVYEEGPGAAHIRRRRSRIARRWGIMGILISIVSVFTGFLVILTASVLIDRYQNELDAAYPEFGLFESTVDPTTLDATQVQNIKVVVLALAILFGLSLVGTVGGILMSIVSYLHSAAYRVDVAPLPDHR